MTESAQTVGFPVSSSLRQRLFSVDAAGPVLLAFPGPAVEPYSLLDEWKGEPTTVLWRQGGEIWCGLGAAREILLTGTSRFDEAVLRSSELERQIAPCAAGAEACFRWFGGFSFSVGKQPERWRGFGDGRFVLPRFTQRWFEGDRLATWYAVFEGTLEQRLALCEQLEVLWEAGNRRAASGPVAALGPPPPEDWLAPNGALAAGWRGKVKAGLAAIEQGHLEKVVLAEHVQVPLRGIPELGELARRFDEGDSSTAGFAFRFGESCFVGSTPERLVRLIGTRCESEALAGSQWPTLEGGEAAAQLLASHKDRHEHEVVVRYLRDRLQHLIDLEPVIEEPSARRVRDLWHLHTQLAGELRHPRHVLELVAALHPTPAVGGRPVAASLRFLADVEGQARGWYASPVGWFNSQGEGDFFVALRSLLVHGEFATLFAGAGIVTGSNPEIELTELKEKMRPARRAVWPWLLSAPSAEPTPRASTSASRPSGSAAFRDG